jgi:hypothetical protein
MPRAAAALAQRTPRSDAPRSGSPRAANPHEVMPCAAAALAQRTPTEWPLAEPHPLGLRSAEE